MVRFSIKNERYRRKRRLGRQSGSLRLFCCQATETQDDGDARPLTFTPLSTSAAPSRQTFFTSSTDLHHQDATPSTSPPIDDQAALEPVSTSRRVFNRPATWGSREPGPGTRLIRAGSFPTRQFTSCRNPQAARVVKYARGKAGVGPFFSIHPVTQGEVGDATNSVGAHHEQDSLRQGAEGAGEGRSLRLIIPEHLRLPLEDSPIDRDEGSGDMYEQRLPSEGGPPQFVQWEKIRSKSPHLPPYQSLWTAQVLSPAAATRAANQVRGPTSGSSLERSGSGGGYGGGYLRSSFAGVSGRRGPSFCGLGSRQAPAGADYESLLQTPPDSAPAAPSNGMRQGLQRSVTERPRPTPVPLPSTQVILPPHIVALLHNKPPTAQTASLFSANSFKSSPKSVLEQENSPGSSSGHHGVLTNPISQYEHGLPAGRLSRSNTVVGPVDRKYSLTAVRLPSARPLRSTDVVEGGGDISFVELRGDGSVPSSPSRKDSPKLVRSNTDVIRQPHRKRRDAMERRVEHRLPTYQQLMAERAESARRKADEEAAGGGMVEGGGEVTKKEMWGGGKVEEGEEVEAELEEEQEVEEEEEEEKQVVGEHFGCAVGTFVDEDSEDEGWAGGAVLTRTRTMRGRSTEEGQVATLRRSLSLEGSSSASSGWESMSSDSNVRVEELEIGGEGMGGVELAGDAYGAGGQAEQKYTEGAQGTEQEAGWDGGQTPAAPTPSAIAAESDSSTTVHLPTPTSIASDPHPRPPLPLSQHSLAALHRSYNPTPTTSTHPENPPPPPPLWRRSISLRDPPPTLLRSSSLRVGAGHPFGAILSVMVTNSREGGNSMSRQGSLARGNIGDGDGAVGRVEGGGAVGGGVENPQDEIALYRRPSFTMGA